MKKLLFCLLIACCGAVCGASAQVTPLAVPRVTPEGVTIPADAESMTLPEFSGVRLDGAMRVHLVRIPETEQARIVYSGVEYVNRPQIDVDEDSLLTVKEKYNAKRTDTTRVFIYYHHLGALRVDRATVTFAEPVEAALFDLYVSGGARLTVDLRVKDLLLTLTGRSEAVCSGEVRYLTGQVSTGELQATGMTVRSVEIEASNSAQVNLQVQERIVMKSSTGATIFYKGNPAIIRGRKAALFGGDIQHLE